MRSSGPAGTLYRRLLRAYPRAFRERHGDEMARLFADKLGDARRRAGTMGVAALWVRTLADVAWNGLAERRAVRQGEAGAGAPTVGGSRDERRGGGMDALMQDVRYAVRTLAKKPGFTLVAVVTIALGIGANTAIFSVVRAVLLRPLPYDQPQELVVLWGEMRNRDVTHFPTSPPDFLDYRRQADLLDDLAAAFSFQVSLTGDGEPVQVDAGMVTWNFFSMLGVDPILGRSFVEEDGTPNDPNMAPNDPGALPGMVILSHALWQERYGGAPDVVGRALEVGGGPAEIVGVMPPAFELLMPANAAITPDADIWLAARIDFENSPRNNVFLLPVGRMRDGVTTVQLQDQIDRVAAGLAETDQVKTTAGYAMRVEGLHEDLTAGVRPVLLALLGAVVFVLLIACANVSNLLLVRASARDRELAVRAAMGGSRGRLIRQMLIESGVLALAGAVLAVLIASGGVSLLLALQPENLPRMDSVRIDGVVLAFTLLAAGGAALVFGALPAFQSSRVELVDALKERGQASSSAGRKLIRSGVVIVEVALSVVLLVGAGLMVRSFVELRGVEPGYQPESVLTFSAAAPFGRYPQASDRAAYNVEVQRRLQSIPGVERASLAFPLPLTGTPFNGRYGDESALTDPEAFRQADYRSVLPGYFEAMGTRLLQGRTFTDADQADSAAVVVVDEKLARTLWPNRSAVGERFLVRVTTPEPQWVEVIGVVEHQRAHDLASEGMETVFFTDRYVGSFGGTWAVRSSVDALALVSAIRAEVAQVDPDVPVADVAGLQSFVDRAMGPTTFALTLIGVFGALALVLASVGLYGVLSFVVRQRTAEIGVRMAFGAESGSILKLVVGQGLALAATGVVVGLLAAFPLTGVMESLLVGVTPTDPLTFGGIAALFLGIAAFASWLPALRATHVDPVTALREE